MASYSTMNTIPAADVESETPLLSRDIKVNAKTLVWAALPRRLSSSVCSPRRP